MKKITLDCYTSRPDVYEYSQISKSTDYLPAWWKKLPASKCPVTGELNSQRTMKSCPGFTDFFKNSYTLPLWSDLKLAALENDWGYQFADEQSVVETHDTAQYEGFMPEAQHFKILSPWKLVCNKPIKWAFVAPTWHDLDAKILSGVVDYYYQNATHINLFLNRPKEIILPLHTPLAHLIPLTEEKIELRHHLVSYNELMRLEKPTLTFTKAYYTIKRLINERSK